MIINKQGQLVANIAQPTVIFGSANEYDAWLATLPNPACEANFIVIKTYELAPGGVYELATNDERVALPANQKVNETLYLVKEDNSGWRWEPGETEGTGTWVQLFGEGFAWQYVITVDTKDDLDDVAPKAENIIYVVKDENAMYRYDTDEGAFEKSAGETAEGLKPVDSVDELDPTKIGSGVNTYVEEFGEFFKHDNEGQDNDLFHATVADEEIWSKRPTATSEPPLDDNHQMYFDKDSSGETVIKVIIDKTDPTKDFEIPKTEFESGVWFKNVADLMADEDTFKVIKNFAKVVIDTSDDHYGTYVFSQVGASNKSKFAKNATVTANALKKVDTATGKTIVLFANSTKFPPVDQLTTLEKDYIFQDLSTGKAYVITADAYVEAGKEVIKEEVITVERASMLPAQPVKGTVYIVEKTDDGKIAGDVKIANPMFDGVTDTRKYIDVGTNISALKDRIEHLEEVADDVIVLTFDNDRTSLVTPKTDTLYVVLETKKCWVIKPKTGNPNFEWVQVGGDDLLNMMPSMTLTEWQSLEVEDRPDYVNITPETGDDHAMFDGFAFTFTNG